MMNEIQKNTIDKMDPNHLHRNMIYGFRNLELHTLLRTFGEHFPGRKAELRERALELLRTRPRTLNYQAYLAKIIELNRSMNNNPNITFDTQRLQMLPIGVQQIQVPSILQPAPQHSQQVLSFQRAMLQNQTGIISQNSFSGINSIQINPSTSSHMELFQVPFNQNVNAVATENLSCGPNNAITSNKPLINIKLKNLPFYRIISEILKPVSLNGHDKCSLNNPLKGMKEIAYKIKLSPEHATIIAMNRDISEGKNEYVYQIQIRINQINFSSTEIADYFPFELTIRVNNAFCVKSPMSINKRTGNVFRPTARPIDCTQFFKFNPNIDNLVIINWIPDEKTYVVGIHLVKKLTSEKLAKKINKKSPRNAEDTKNYIIRELANLDPELITTAYRFSLVCPLGMIRMKTPAKSIHCNHLQCFDVHTFIMMNENKPKWICPICNKPCLYDDIQVQSYFLEVISSPNLPANCEEIELLADGSWKVYKKRSEEPVEIIVKSNENPIDTIVLDDSDDDNYIEVKKNHNLNLESLKESEILKPILIDWTKDKVPPKENDKQLNKAQAANDVQPVTTIDLNPPAQVQPQQDVTSSDQEVVNEKKDRSSPTSPTSTTVTF